MSEGVTKFQIGDTVRLKSGGPLMTVHGFGGDPCNVVCQYFGSGGFFIERVFREEQLCESTVPVPGAEETKDHASRL